MKHLFTTAALILMAVALGACAVTPSAESIAALETLIAQASTAMPAALGTAQPAAAETPTPPPTETPAAGVPLGECTYGVTFLGDVTVRDGSEVPAGSPLLKTWRVRNTGDCPWDARVVLRQVAGDALTRDRTLPVPVVAPGEVAQISVPARAPEAPGHYRAFWRLASIESGSFGAALYVDIVVPGEDGAVASASPVVLATEQPTPVPCEPDLYLVGDVTIEDDTVMAPGVPFAKVWRLMNNGACAWPADAVLRHVHGTRMAAVEAVPLGAVAPGRVLDVTAVMYAPDEPGTYVSHWAMCDQAGECCGPWVYVRIVVSGDASLGPAETKTTTSKQ